MILKFSIFLLTVGGLGGIPLLLGDNQDPVITNDQLSVYDPKTSVTTVNRIVGPSFLILSDISRKYWSQQLLKTAGWLTHKAIKESIKLIPATELENGLKKIPELSKLTQQGSRTRRSTPPSESCPTSFSGSSIQGKELLNCLSDVFTRDLWNVLLVASVENKEARLIKKITTPTDTSTQDGCSWATTTTIQSTEVSSSTDSSSTDNSNVVQAPPGQVSTTYMRNDCKAAEKLKEFRERWMGLIKEKSTNGSTNTSQNRTQELNVVKSQSGSKTSELNLTNYFTVFESAELSEFVSQFNANGYLTSLLSKGYSATRKSEDAVKKAAETETKKQ